MAQYYPILITLDNGFTEVVDFIKASSVSQALNQASKTWRTYYMSIGVELQEIFAGEIPNPILQEIFENEARQLFGKSFSQLEVWEKLSVSELVMEA